MFRFSDIVEIQGRNKNVTEKIISDGKEVRVNRNNTETDYDSVEDPLNTHRTASNDTALVFEIPNIIIMRKIL